MSNLTLHNADCIAGLADLPAGCARLIFADPPYNLSGAGHQSVRGGRLTACDKGAWDAVADIDAFNLAWIEACKHALADDGTIWISGTLHNHPSVGMALKKLGLWLINDVVWYKHNAPPLRVCTRFAPSTELIWLAAKSKKYYFDYALAKRMNGGKQMRNLWQINAARHVTAHPTEKPLALLRRIVQIGSAAGDLVLDPFMGSGTTGVVARELGRDFVGFEIDAGYFAMAEKRIRDADNASASQLSLAAA